MNFCLICNKKLHGLVKGNYCSLHKLKPIYYCINNCGNKVSGVNRQCHSCASKGKNNPRYGKRCSEVTKEKMRLKLNVKGKNNPRYIDGRTLQKYYCIDCGKELNSYRAKRCGSCSVSLSIQQEWKINTKRRINRQKAWSKENNPNWRGGNIAYRGASWKRTKIKILNWN